MTASLTRYRDIKAIKHVYPYIVPDHWSYFRVIYKAKGCGPMERWINLIFDRIWNLILVDALTLASFSKTGDFPYFSKYSNLWCIILCNFYNIISFWKVSFFLFQKFHTSYLSRTPRTSPCRFFLAGVNFYRFNAKNWLFTV